MTKQSVLWGWVAGFSVMVVLAGCAGTARMPAGKSLHDRLGGKPSIPAVVDQFVANMAADTRINGRLRPPIIGNSRATSSIKSA